MGIESAKSLENTGRNAIILIQYGLYRSALQDGFFHAQKQPQPMDFSVGCGFVSGAISKTKQRGFASSPQKNKKTPGGVFFNKVIPHGT
ncbi:MAG: hypothetical protein U0M10_04925 [Oscillospiraceae bacterium]|nr:hypothetical protein [Oscillospiraceae bacterium]